MLSSYFFISSTNVLAGLNAGKSCAGMLIVVFFEILRAVFSARCFTIKLPKPRKYTFSLLSKRLLLIASINDSTTTATSYFAIPVLSVIPLMISALVISYTLNALCIVVFLFLTDCKITNYQ